MTLTPEQAMRDVNRCVHNCEAAEAARQSQMTLEHFARRDGWPLSGHVKAAASRKGCQQVAFAFVAAAVAVAAIFVGTMG